MPREATLTFFATWSSKSAHAKLSDVINVEIFNLKKK